MNVDLTDKEREILDLLVAGKRVPEIAATVSLTEGYVRNILATLRRAENVATTLNLVVKYAQWRQAETKAVS